MIRRARAAWPTWILGIASALALGGFAWPLVAAAAPHDAQTAVPIVALALVPALVVAVSLVLDRELQSATTIALLGVLTAVGAAVRIVGTGVGGVELVFIVLILGGRAFGARFGLLLGMLTIASSSLLWGGIGPWTPFQAFACAWVGAGAGLLPRIRLRTERASARLEVGMLAVYGVVAAYVFGLVMNLWFWPFAVGPDTTISYEPGAPLGRNLVSFWLYSLVTSTATWDTVRALVTLIGILLVGRPALAALRRARITPRSSAPRGGGTRTRPSTAPDAAAAPPTARRRSGRG